MSMSAEKAALDQWYCLEALQHIEVGRAASRLLGVDLVIARDDAGIITVTVGGDDTPLPIRQRYGHLWTTLGRPATDLLPIAEADETDRRVIVCGAISVKTSGLRIVENFL